jgi:hypothetical protein
VAGSYRKLHNKKLHNFYDSPIIIIRAIQSRMMKWMGYIARMGEMRNS